MILCGCEDRDSGDSCLSDCRFKCCYSVFQVGRCMNEREGVEGKVKGIAEE